MKTYRTTLDDLWGHEVEIEITFSIDPGEREVRYYPDGSGHPGCPASIELATVRLLSVDNVPRVKLDPIQLYVLECSAQLEVEHDLDNNGPLVDKLFETASPPEPDFDPSDYLDPPNMCDYDFGD